MSYTTTALIEQFIGRTLTAGETSFLNAVVIPAVDKWIDRSLSSTFGNVSETTRYYEGGWRSIDIDPAQDITAVGSINDDGTDSSDYTNLVDYVAEPANETIKREIVRRGRPYRHFQYGLQRFAVTAKFTEFDYLNSKVPEDIQLAATRIASGVLVAGTTAGTGGTVQSESLEGHSITYDVNSDTINTIAASDPILQGILSARREVYV